MLWSSSENENWCQNSLFYRLYVPKGVVVNYLAGNYVVLRMRPVRGARWPTMAPPLNFRFNANQQSGSYYLPSLLKRESAGVDCMQRASFITSSMVWLARCKILVPLQLMGWSSAQACSVIADLSVWHLTQASLCSLSLVSEASLGLLDVDLSTRAWYLTHWVFTH